MKRQEKEMYNAMVHTVEKICILAAFFVTQVSFGQEGPVVAGNNQPNQVNKLDVRQGWLPEAREWETKTAEGSEAQTTIRSLLSLGDWERNLLTQENKVSAQKVEKVKKVKFVPTKIKEAGDSDKNYAVVLSATWCGPCKTLEPIVEELQRDGYIIYKFDTDDKRYSKFFDKDHYDLPGVLPTIIFVENGVVEDKAVGLLKKDVFMQKLKTRSEQEPKPKPSPKPSPNIYDEL